MQVAEREKEGERDTYIRRCALHVYNVLENIAFHGRRIAIRKSAPKGVSFLSTKSRRTQIVGLAFCGACTRRVYTWKLVRKVTRLRLESTELQTVDIHPKNVVC